MNLGDTTRYVNKLAMQVNELRDQRRADIAACVRDKRSMPDNYWQPLHRAEEKLRAARALLGVLIEDRFDGTPSA